MVPDPGEEDLEDEGPVVEEGYPRHLEVHGEVGHVRLQLGKGLLALAPHVVLKRVHLGEGRVELVIRPFLYTESGRISGFIFRISGRITDKLLNK